MKYTIINGELYHFGIKGMKWGHRKKYYNTSGSLSKVDQARQNYKNANREYKKARNTASNYSNLHPVSQWYGKNKIQSDARWEDARKKKATANEASKDYKKAKQDYKNSSEGQAAAAAKRNHMIKTGIAVAGTALAVYGTYKLGKAIKNKNFEIAIEKGNKAHKDYLNNNAKELIAPYYINGKYRVGVNTISGQKISRTEFRTKKRAEKYLKTLIDANDAAKSEADKIYRKHVTEAANDNLAKAAKNVAKYYYDKRKRR